MVFGEIIEPSSRALWDDDFFEYPEEEGPQLQVSGNFDVPPTVHKLIIGESGNIINILKRCILHMLEPICEVPTTGASLYKIDESVYVLAFKPQGDVVVGKVTEMFIPWLNAANNIYVLTSSRVTSLQNCNANGSCVIKYLSNYKIENGYSRLEVPNLVTGLSASIFSYAIHKKLNCSLYVGFLEDVPLDSVNTRPVLDLLRTLGVHSITNYVLEDFLPLNNLYM